jgi:hypothetical protein
MPIMQEGLARGVGCMTRRTGTPEISAYEAGVSRLGRKFSGKRKHRTRLGRRDQQADGNAGFCKSGDSSHRPGFMCTLVTHTITVA